MGYGIGTLPIFFTIPNSMLWVIDIHSNPLILFQFVRYGCLLSYQSFNLYPIVCYGVTVSEGRVGFKGGVNKKFFTFFKAYYISNRKQELHRAIQSKTELLKAKNCKEGSFHHKTAKIGRKKREGDQKRVLNHLSYTHI